MVVLYDFKSTSDFAEVFRIENIFQSLLSLKSRWGDEQIQEVNKDSVQIILLQYTHNLCFEIVNLINQFDYIQFFVVLVRFHDLYELVVLLRSIFYHNLLALDCTQRLFKSTKVDRSLQLIATNNDLTSFIRPKHELYSLRQRTNKGYLAWFIVFQIKQYGVNTFRENILKRVCPFVIYLDWLFLLNYSGIIFLILQCLNPFAKWDISLSLYFDFADILTLLILLVLLTL